MHVAACPCFLRDTWPRLYLYLRASTIASDVQVEARNSRPGRRLYSKTKVFELGCLGTASLSVSLSLFLFPLSLDVPLEDVFITVPVDKGVEV